MIITNHAYNKLKSRTGLNKSSFEKLLADAEKEGIRHNDTCGSLRKYFDKVYLTHRNSTATIIYHNFVFVLNGETLITLYAVPHNIQKLIDNMKKEK